MRSSSRTPCHRGSASEGLDWGFGQTPKPVVVKWKVGQKERD
uniref:Uncharacterized protein n=1 Tax=Arundo donax TaxID=35708 RepID=A0A0A9HF04_ARUDO